MLKDKIKGFLLIIVLLLFWQIFSQLQLISRIILPSPSDIVKAFISMLLKGRLMTDIFYSIKRVFVGFAFASLLGVPLGMFLGWHRNLADYFLHTIELLRPIPPIAWIPLAILWFGIKDTSSYFITALASFFPIFVNSFVGARNVEKVHINAAQSLGASRRFIITHILFPSALPFIITGIRVGLGVGWMSVIAAELIAAQSGLGYMIQLNRMLLNIPEVIVGMAVIGIIGSAMNWSITLLQKRFIPWKQD